MNDVKVAYIIGPYRSNTVWGIRFNIQQAERLAAVCAHVGVFPYCPHKNTAYFDGLASDDLFLAGNLTLIDRGIADFAVASRYWKNSVGSINEVERFKRWGYEIVYEEDQPNNLVLEEAIKEAAYGDSLCH
jgi:hypothetical protein